MDSHGLQHQSSTAPTDYQLDGTKDYPFLASTEEHKRLNEQSAALNELMHGKFTHAPVESPKRILYVGCGTCIQTVLLAQLYPEVEVIGVDPNAVPVSDKPKPDNVTYILGKLEDLVRNHERLQPESFDLVYQRYLTMIVRDWPKHISQLRCLLRPGGWLECQEGSFYVIYDANRSLISKAWKFPSVVWRGTNELSLDIRIGTKLENCRQEASAM